MCFVSIYTQKCFNKNRPIQCDHCHTTYGYHIRHKKRHYPPLIHFNYTFSLFPSTFINQRYYRQNLNYYQHDHYHRHNHNQHRHYLLIYFHYYSPIATIKPPPENHSYAYTSPPASQPNPLRYTIIVL